MIGRLFLTSGALGLQCQFFATSNALSHPSEYPLGHSPDVHAKHRILALISSGQFFEPRVRCVFFDQPMKIGNGVNVNESHTFELLKYWVRDDLLQRRKVLTIRLKNVFGVELIDVVGLPTCSNCNCPSSGIVRGKKGAICKRSQGPIGDFHVLLMKFGCRGHLHSCIDNRRYCYPSSKRADPLSETIGFIFPACEIADRECAENQKNQQHSGHSVRNVPAQPITSIVFRSHVAPPLFSGWTIGDSNPLLQWGRAA